MMQRNKYQSHIGGLRALMQGDKIWIAIGLMLGSVLELLFRTVSARMLDTNDFGQLTYLNSVLLVLGSIATLGMGNVVPRYIPIFRDKSIHVLNQFLRVSLKVSLLSGSAFFLIVIMSAYLFHVFDNRSATIIAFLIPLYVLSELFYAINRGFHNAKQASLQREVVRRGVPILVLVVVYVLLPTVSLDMCLYAIGVGLFSAVVYGKRGISIAGNTHSPALPLKEIYVYALPLVLSTALMQVNARLDVFIANANLSEHELGIYSASIVLPQLLALMPGIFTFSLLPKLAVSCQQQDWLDVRKQLLQTTTTLTLFATGVAGTLWIGSSWWIELIFGEKYVVDDLLIDLLTLSNYIMACFGGVGVTLLAAGKTGKYLMSDIVALVCGGASQWFLSQEYGLFGLAFGLLLTVFLVVLVRGVFVYQLLKGC